MVSRGRPGLMKILETLPAQARNEMICSALRKAGFTPLDALGPAHLRAAVEAWRLCRLGVVTELLTVLRELSALSSLDLLASFALDLSARPPRGFWPADRPLRVANLAWLLATQGIDRAIGRKELRHSARLTEPALEGLWVGALLHDVGLALVPPEVVDGMSFLDERAKEHPRLGYEALRHVVWPWPEVLPIVLHHHEKWDGSGYPEGLAGEDIPWAAQMVALADFCDALSTPQVYRRSFTPQELAERVESEAGTAFNPLLVRALRNVWDEVAKLLQR